MKIRLSVVPFIFLSPLVCQAADDPAAVVVTATRQLVRANELVADVSVIEREEIERSTAGSLAQLLSSQPGVEFTNNGSLGSQTDILIRGASTNQTVVLIDGMRIGSATSGNANWSRIPLSQIERIEILRGPASSLYGSDAIGGVIQVFTRRGEGAPRFNAELGYGSYNTVSGSAGVVGGVDGWRYGVNASATNSDGFNNISNPQKNSYNPDRDNYNGNSFSGMLSYAPAKGHELGANLLHSTGRNRFDTGTTATTRAIDYVSDQTVQSVNLYSRNAITSLWSSTVRLGTSFDDSTQYNNAARNSLFRTDQQQMIWQNDIKLPSAGNLMLAWESLKQGLTSTTAYPVKGRNIRSLVAGWSVNPGDHRIQTSIRRDNNSQFGGRTTGTVGYGYQLMPEWRGSASYGTSFRAPTFNQLYSPSTSGGRAFGNPNLLPEAGRNREVAVHYEGLSHRASLTVYRNTVTNLITTSQFPAINLGFATLNGETLAYDGRVMDIDVQASFDHQRTMDDTGKVLPRRAGQHGRFVVGRTLGPWEGRAEVVAVGMRYDDVANDNRMGGYTLFNLSGSYNFERDWSLFGRVDNLFGKKYETALDFATPRANIFIGVRYAPK